MGRPKRHNPLLAAFGGLVGAAAGPVGAAAGAGLGALIGAETPTLEEALRQALNERGLDLVSIRSSSRHAVSILFRDKAGRFRTIPVEVSLAGPDAADDIDDRLYDAAIKKLALAAS